MRIFFDVDYTLLSVDRVLRPGTREVFARLAGDGHEVFVWSGTGLEWALDVVNTHGLGEHVRGVFAKPDALTAEGLQTAGIPHVPDFVVDDHRVVVDAFGGYCIRCYYYADRRATGVDPDLELAYAAISNFFRSPSRDAASTRRE